jgi:cytochrome c biogenesis protein CcdA
MLMTIWLFVLYVSYFVESNTQEIITANSNSRLILVRRLTRGGLIGLLVTASFIVTFGLTGIAISSLGIGIAKFLPWIAVASGIVIIGIGVAKIFGRTINIDIPSPLGLLYTTNSGNESGKKPSFVNFFLFGIGYSIASLSCTLPLFLLIVFQSLDCIYGVRTGNGKYNDGNFHCNKCIKPDIYQMVKENRTKNEYCDKYSIDTSWKLFDLL